ncbi:MAG TPA: glycosyltransferase family 4 protein [Myxococcota bacterium]|nr:glycosyltransferase family 4 protein [Myxococcota bacterium]
MKILQISRVFWPNIGGIEKHVQWLAEALVRRGHQVDVVTLTRSFADNPPYPAYSCLNVPESDGKIHVYRVPFVGSTRYPIAPRIRRFIPRYDLVHVHGIDFAADWVTATRSWHRRPIVLSTHGGFFHTNFAAGLKPLWFQTATRSMLRFVDQLLCTSEADFETFSRVTDRGRLLTQAVDLRPWRRLPRQPEAGAWVNIGRVDVHKGIADLLRTLALVRDKDSRPFTMEIIGPEVVPGLVAELSAQRDALKLHQQVHFRGKLPFSELQAAVSRAELGLFPAEYESFGISVVETMAAGLVPVLADIRAFRSFVQEGRNGFITDYKKPEQAAQSILRARDQAAALGPAAQKTAADYDWDRVVIEVEAVYQSLLGARPAAG